MADELSPMMQKYMETKEEYKDCILFYRLGDFYEMFFDDAILASKELELTLTGKNCGTAERAPMCGVPFHAADVYINKLVEKGHKVAICEQLEDPKTAKGLVKRDVIRIVTPGTTIDMQSLDETRNNYIMSVAFISDTFGIAISDITTGEFRCTEVGDSKKLLDEIYKFAPTELICNDSFFMCDVNTEELSMHLNVSINALDSSYCDEKKTEEALILHFGASWNPEKILHDFPVGKIASGMLMQYLYETQKNNLAQIRSLSVFHASDYMVLDASTRRNLELCETILGKEKRGSLLWVLDKTKTAMGARCLRNFLEQPLCDKSQINKRLDVIEMFMDDMVMREEMREYLQPVYDLERLMGKINYHSANPRDLLAFSTSLQFLPAIKNLLKDKKGKLITKLYDQLDPLTDLYELIVASISEDAPLSLREGGIIKTGFNETVDSLRNAKTDGKKWLSQLEAEDKERTGIKNLRIKYNRVFGYYFEVTNSFKELVPPDYIRKQTLTGAERYTNEKLKSLEDTILNAEDKLFSLEYNLFCEIRSALESQVDRILLTAKTIAMLDAFASLAYVAEKYHYVRPTLNEKGIIEIKGGRHPVVEQMIPADSFVDNDSYLDNGENRIAIITGPNMAGKSTYMRQTAIIVLMAQIGSFVPAKSANIGIVDRIFTRVGASDDLSSGRSTFMVEMSEVANILDNATSKSLILLDEIGRGTSTFDGLSIAWAVTEHISNPKLLGAKTMFATHYHELTELEGKLSGVKNYCVAVKEKGDTIAFLRKIVRGGADKSYGIAVAKIAGLPEIVIKRANEIVSQLSDNDITQGVRSINVPSVSLRSNVHKNLDEVDLAQISLFDTVSDNDVLEELKELDLNNLTPMDALSTLCMLQNKLKNRW